MIKPDVAANESGNEDEGVERPVTASARRTYSPFVYVSEVMR